MAVERSERRSSTSRMARPPLDVSCAPAISRPIFSSVISAAGWASDSWPREMHGDAVGDLEDLVEILADDQHRRAGAGEIDQRLADRRRGAGIDAPGRLVDDQHGGLAIEFAADDEFLQIAAGQRARFRIGLALAHVEVLLDPLADVAAPRRSRGTRLRTSPASAEWRVSTTFSDEREARHRAMTQAFLGHEGGAELAPLGDADMAAGRAIDDDAPRRGRFCRSPEMASNSSDCPLPATPAIATISPPCTSSEISLRATANGPSAGMIETIEPEAHAAVTLAPRAACTT